MAKPILSIGIIFKNEIHCLERCLKSLQKLRDTVPCEVVMADTGSEDGSHKVAERYADILFNFPWINDFSAARNAVMDRCSGRWYLSVDADEWLDEDIAELVQLAESDGGNVDKVCWLIIRNYMNPSDLDDYGDIYAARICRMSTGLRYHGAIHEFWSDAGQVCVMFHTILHHDGYALDDTAWKHKHKRNMELLCKALEQSPDDLQILMQCAEGGQDEPDYLDFVNRAVKGVEDHKTDWEYYGPPIFRQAVRVAGAMDLPTFDIWVKQAEEMFPESVFIRIDIQFIALNKCWENQKYEECVRRGEDYLRALADNQAGRGDVTGKLFSTLSLASPTFARDAQILLAGAYLRTGDTAQGAQLLESLEPSEMNPLQLNNYALLIQELHRESDWDTLALVIRAWDRLFTSAVEDKERKARKDIFMIAATRTMDPTVREKEPGTENFHRYTYTLYLPLRDRCDLGRFAAILASDDPMEISELLEQIKDWNGLPAYLLTHALERGIRFPLPGKSLNIEEMDHLSARLVKNREQFLPLVLKLSADVDGKNFQQLCWARGLVMTAVRIYSWNSKEHDEEQGMALARAFAKVEGIFLPHCYVPETLQEEALFVLPPLHRFGFYCAQAFEALESGDTTGYVRLLRAGLKSCGVMKDMVEFLIDNTPELQTPPSPELLALADQVRVILARFEPNDPAVETIRQSEAYQKVEHLIFGRHRSI